MPFNPELIEIYLDENGDPIIPPKQHHKQKEGFYEDVGNTEEGNVTPSKIQVKQ
jgi:hypothetical protein